mmetsp:Transcript_29932/g.73656  ORF Transcript_29932/g.73656 Transcript_29932/m.73656 type:complete len:242 (+) Transcript_29932:75-800(+)
MARHSHPLLALLLLALFQGASSFSAPPTTPLTLTHRAHTSSRSTTNPPLSLRAPMTRSARAVVRMSAEGQQKVAASEVIASLNEQLWSAAADGNLLLIKRLVEEGADVNAQQPDYDEDEIVTPDPEDKHVKRPGYSPLHMSALMGEAAAIHLLVELGANVNSRTEGESTPLHIAAVNGRAGAVRALHEEGADLFAENEFGRTPLMMAKLFWRHKKTIKLLKELCGEDTDEPEWTDTAITGC